MRRATFPTATLLIPNLDSYLTWLLARPGTQSVWFEAEQATLSEWRVRTHLVGTDGTDMSAACLFDPDNGVVSRSNRDEYSLIFWHLCPEYAHLWTAHAPQMVYSFDAVRPYLPSGRLLAPSSLPGTFQLVEIRLDGQDEAAGRDFLTTTATFRDAANRTVWLTQRPQPSSSESPRV